MTERIYYRDSYETDFSAVVVGQRNVAGKAAVILDRTAFYPTSGGQPNDKGVLGSAEVVDVVEDEAGEILHVLEGAVPSGRVEGRIDWNRRFDHMQQHTGQHVLSQAFLHVADAATVSFHLGTDTATIDVTLPAPSHAVVNAAQDAAAQVVFENRPVNILFVGREELATLGVRKESNREGEIRVIEVQGFDRSPCGGTHVRQTGEIGSIAILGFERYKGGTRVEFVCGWRTLRYLRKDHAVLAELGGLLSAHPYDLPRLVGKALEEKAELAREAARLRSQLLEFEAAVLISAAQESAGVRIIARNLGDRAIEEAKILAQSICRTACAVAVFGVTRGSGQVVLARNAAVALDCGATIRKTAARLGGRGGGRPELAQAGGIAADAVDGWIADLVAGVAGGA
jgi:alanyl-tRNA synthetase